MFAFRLRAVPLAFFPIILLALVYMFVIQNTAQADLSLGSARYKEDFNGDGEVSIGDVIALIIMIHTGSDDQLADYNGNGKCDITDAVQLLINILEDDLTTIHSEPSPIQPAPVQIIGPLVVSNNWPECTDLVTWAHSIFRLDNVLDASETRRGISLFKWVRLFNRVGYGGMQQAYEGAPGGEEYVVDAHKNLFVYGWGYCDTHSRIAEALWREMTGDLASAYRVCVRNPSGGYHTMYRLRLDGNYGAFDPRYGYYLIDQDSPDARVLDWDEVGVDSNFVRNEKFENRSQPFFEFPTSEKPSALRLEPIYWDRESDWEAASMPYNQVFASPKYQVGTQYHDMNWRLPRGTTISRYWDNTARKYYIPVNRESDFLPTGRFYRVTEDYLDGNWPKYDPNYQWAKTYLDTVPVDEGYPDWMAGGRTIGQAWGKITYEPDLAGEGYLDALVECSNLAHRSQAPYIIPLESGAPAEAVFDFYSPYVLVDSEFFGELAAGENDGVSLELRTLKPKPRSRDQSDSWSKWEEIVSGSGTFDLKAGRESYVSGKVSVHGKYRFQLRLKAYAADTCETVGLKRLEIVSYFENGIMSIPRITPGRNTITLKVLDTQAVRAPIRITYNYRSADSTKKNEHTIQPEDFENLQASYTLNVPDLERCNSLEIRY